MQKLSSFGQGKKFRPKKSLTSLLHAALQLQFLLIPFWAFEMIPNPRDTAPLMQPPMATKKLVISDEKITALAFVWAKIQWQRCTCGEVQLYMQPFIYVIRSTSSDMLLIM